MDQFDTFMSAICPQCGERPGRCRCALRPALPSACGRVPTVRSYSGVLGGVANRKFSVPLHVTIVIAGLGVYVADDWDGGSDRRAGSFSVEVASTATSAPTFDVRHVQNTNSGDAIEVVAPEGVVVGWDESGGTA